MGCWHGCGPAHCAPTPRAWYGPVDEYGWYEDVDRPLRGRARERVGERDARTASLEASLEDLRDELRRVEAALEKLTGGSATG